MEKWYEIRKVYVGPLEDVKGQDEELDFQLYDLDVEFLIMHLDNRKEVEILLFKTLGFKYDEVAPLINTSISEYYILLRSLKHHIKEQVKRDE